MKREPLPCPICAEPKVVTELDPHAYDAKDRQITFCRSCGTIFGSYIAARGRKDRIEILHGAALT
jgi:nitrogenase molybdenum-iron protein alpha/beta subunit